jgi:hypothetical protein
MENDDISGITCVELITKDGREGCGGLFRGNILTSYETNEENHENSFKMQ